MRTLMSSEMEQVGGGDPDIDANLVACATSFGFAGLATGQIHGAAAAGFVGASAIPGVPTCQVVTTAIGSAIGGGAADLADGFNDLIVEVGDALSEMAMTLNRGTL